MSSKLVSEELEKYVIDLRRHFHRNPELSLQETQTVQRICQELDSMGLSWVSAPPNSIVACLKGDSDGKRLAIRADIDALPMKEESGLPFSSQTDGAAHTCGHDAHTAILLGAAKYLSAHRRDIHGTIYFCFQCAEEVLGGGKALADYLSSIGGVDQVCGLHVFPELLAGQISIECGARMAGAGILHVDVHGRGGHGSRPDRCIDPIRTACELIQKMSAFPSNHHNALDPTVVNIAQIHAGTATNIVPETAFFEGSLRYFTPGVNEEMEHTLRRMAAGTAMSYNADIDVDITWGCPPVINSKDASETAQRAVSQIDGLTAVELEPDVGSDDYAMLSSVFGGLYAFLGISSPGRDWFPHHHPRFYIDESALKYGVEFFIRYSKEYLKF